MTDVFPKFYVLAADGLTHDIRYVKRYISDNYVLVGSDGSHLSKGQWDSECDKYVRNGVWIEVTEEQAREGAKPGWKTKYYKRRESAEFASDVVYLERYAHDQYQAFNSLGAVVTHKEWGQCEDGHVASGEWVEVSEADAKRRVMTENRFLELYRIRDRIGQLGRNLQAFKDERHKIDDWMKFALKPETLQAIEDDVNAKIAELKAEFANG